MTTAPATESIMGSLSADKAGVGSAVNDTTRELGGTLGVAVIGSVFNSVYIGALRGGTVFERLPEIARRPTEDSVGAAKIVAQRLPADLATAYLKEVSDAFLSGLGLACLVTAGVAVAGSIFASVPAGPSRRSVRAAVGHDAARSCDGHVRRMRRQSAPSPDPALARGAPVQGPARQS